MTDIFGYGFNLSKHHSFSFLYFFDKEKPSEKGVAVKDKGKILY